MKVAPVNFNDKVFESFKHEYWASEISRNLMINILLDAKSSLVGLLLKETGDRCFLLTKGQ